MHDDHAITPQDQVKKLMELFSDDINVLRDIVHEFTVNHYVSNIIGTLEDAIRSEDYQVIIQLAHKLKGCFSYFQIKELTDSASKLERLGKDKSDIGQIGVALDEVKIQYQTLETILLETIRLSESR